MWKQNVENPRSRPRLRSRNSLRKVPIESNGVILTSAQKWPRITQRENPFRRGECVGEVNGSKGCCLRWAEKCKGGYVVSCLQAVRYGCEGFHIGWRTVILSADVKTSTNGLNV